MHLYRYFVWTFALFRILDILAIAVRLLVLLLVARSSADADPIGTLITRRTPKLWPSCPVVAAFL